MVHEDNGAARGKDIHNQMISVEDLGEAMYLPFLKNLPGIYNVAADDAVPTRWCFKATRAFVIPLPTFLLKLIANIAFKLHLFPASERLGQPERVYNFLQYGKIQKSRLTGSRSTPQGGLHAVCRVRKRDAKDTPKQALLTFLYKTPWLTKLSLQGLNALFYVIEKTPFLADLVSCHQNQKKQHDLSPHK